jgi:hypothetical protein
MNGMQSLVSMKPIYRKGQEVSRKETSIAKDCTPKEHKPKNSIKQVDKHQNNSNERNISILATQNKKPFL